MSAAEKLPAPGYSEDTGPRILAYLASMRPLEGVAESTKYQRGQSLIERLAINARGTKRPTLRLTRSQCADVMSFIRWSEPFEPRDWWADPADAPSHLVGFYMVLDALESGLREVQP